MTDLSIENLFGVKGIVAVITGGGSGLGLYIAKALDQAGAKAVYIIGRRKESLDHAASLAINKSIIPIVGDVTSKESLSSIAAQVKKEQGFINVLFANSGITGVKSSDLGLPKDRTPSVKEFVDAMWKPEIDEFTAAFHVNVSGAFYTCLAFLELLDAGNRSGNVTQKSNIIVTSSIGGLSRKVAAGYSYSFSKAAVNQLVKMLSTSFGDYKIRVNGIAPGFFPSEMTGTEGIMAGKDGKKVWEEGGLDKSFAPIERSGTEEEMAGTALYLAGKGGAYVNGCIMIVDGGRLSQLPSSY